MLIAGRRRENHPVQSSAEQQTTEFCRSICHVAEGQYHQTVTGIFQPGECSILQFDDITRTRSFVSQADQIAAAGYQALRGDIGMVVERCGGILDPLAGFRVDMRRIV